MAKPKAPDEKAPAVAREQALYLVGRTPIRHDGKSYPLGSTVAMSAGQANRLGLLPAPVAGEK